MKAAAPSVARKAITAPSRASERLSFDALLPASNNEWSRATLLSILKRFRAAYKSVPAYRSFLDKLGVDPAAIKSKNIASIPPMSKANYLRAHPWQTLCTKGALAGEPLVLTATSGSTGEPFYIPRTDELHEASAIYHRLFIERSGLDPKKPTLVVICFGMGVWIGGILTYEAFRRVSERGWPLTLITPGVNKKEIFEALSRVAPAYEQLVICGYPPFVKDVIDEAPQHGIKWKRWDVRIVCAAEAFSETFRDYLMEKTGMEDPHRSVMNIYGSAELGAMATETPLAILLRRLAIKNQALYSKLFKEAHRLPTLAQFIPQFAAFDSDEKGRVYVTGGSALPLVRYDIGDSGGVFSFTDAVAACKETGIDLLAEIKRARITDTVVEMPFVYIYERTDLSTKLYGAIIYPEHVKIGLLKPEFERIITGRFTMSTEHDAAHDEYLEVNIELQRVVKSGENVRKAVTESIVESLIASSGEYQNNHANMGARVMPRLVFWPHEDPKYFPSGIKQKWVKKAK